MDCPKCHNSEISPSLICLVCGYHLDEELKTGEEIKEEPPIEEAAENRSSPAEREIPQWRQELSERLRAVKQKKEANKKDAPRPIEPVIAVETRQRPRVPVPQTKQFPEPSTLRTPVPQQKMLEPLPREIRAAKDPREVEKLIDKAVSRKSIRSVKERISSLATPVSVQQQPDFYEDKLILLSRTLSGLIDLMLVVLFAVIFIIASDYYSGIVILDYISFAIYIGLFLLIYFAYSIFFLAASTQTIGMMITDLRVVGNDRKRPRLHQIIGRCVAFLFSLFGLGIGLAWSLFNDESLCFHDRVSRTRVIRI